ncbi:MAG: hypothetical protein HQK89_08115 [Nitrospirae bacterium]|nr:hypothetical protein [Nitrospirota bacterium]
MEQTLSQNPIHCLTRHLSSPFGLPAQPGQPQTPQYGFDNNDLQVNNPLRDALMFHGANSGQSAQDSQPDMSPLSSLARLSLGWPWKLPSSQPTISQSSTSQSGQPTTSQYGLDNNDSNDLLVNNPLRDALMFRGARSGQLNRLVIDGQTNMLPTGTDSGKGEIASATLTMTILL